MLYDQLAVVTPIVMALSAAAPIYRGYLCDVDCRWDVVSAACDDRTDEVRYLCLLCNLCSLFIFSITLTTDFRGFCKWAYNPINGDPYDTALHDTSI